MNSCPLECGVKINKSFYAHLNKCKRKDFLGKEYLKCKYNYMHIIKKGEYEKHLENCEKKNKLDEGIKIIREKVNSNNNNKNNDSDSSDNGDLTKILQKIRTKKIKSLVYNEEDGNLHYEGEDNKLKDNEIIKNPLLFDNNDDIDEDSKAFYKLFLI